MKNKKKINFIKVFILIYGSGIAHNTIIQESVRELPRPLNLNKNTLNQQK